MTAAAISDAFAAMLARLASPYWEAAPPQAPIGPELDGLAAALPFARWDAQRHALHQALRAITPRHTIAVLTMARDEARHLPEWIAHYLAIGAEHIFVYTNDNHDGTDELLRWFGGHAPVTTLVTTVETGVNVQLKNYQHAFFLLPELRLYDWVLVVDADEFLVPAACHQHSLPQMLRGAPAQAAAILYPWLWRLWERDYAPEPGLLARRYQHAIPHALFKSAVRLNRVTSLCEIHVPTPDPDATLLDSAFDPLPPGGIWTKAHKTMAGGWIDHFWGRSFMEFVAKKRRGDLLSIPAGHFRRDHESFFAWTAPCTAENFWPVPAPVVAGMQRQLARWAEDAAFSALVARLDRRAAAEVESLRGDAGLYARYRNLHGDIAPGLQPAPAFEPSGPAKAPVAVPLRIAPPPGLADLALGRPATQSSVSEWSHAATPALDAAGAVSGRLTGGYGFHTALEDRPWWQVDLGDAAEIHQVRIHNRLDNPIAADRCLQFGIEVSTDGQAWTEIGRKTDAARFGGADGAPYVFAPAAPVATRFLRIMLLGRNFLHFDAIEIFGRSIPAW